MNFVNEIKKNEISAKFSLKSFLDKIIPALLLSTYSFYIYEQISLYATKIKYKHLFQYNFLTPIMVLLTIVALSAIYKLTFGRKNLFAFFTAVLGIAALVVRFQMPEVKVPLELFTYTVIPLGIFSGLYALYFVVYCSTARVNVNFRSLEVITGVFSLTKDGTDLTKIDDCDLQRSTLDLILGLGRLKLKIKQKKEEMSIKGLTKLDAENMYNYIRANAFGTSTEYWTARDQQRQSNKIKGGGYIQEDISADDGDEADLPEIED